MGVDFMSAHAKSFMKKIDDSRVDLVRRTLFTRDPDTIATNLVARTPGVTLTPEQDVLACLKDGRVLLLDGIQERGELVRPPAEVLDKLAATGGFATVRVTRTLPLADLVEVCLR